MHRYYFLSIFHNRYKQNAEISKGQPICAAKIYRLIDNIDYITMSIYSNTLIENSSQIEYTLIKQSVY